MRKRLIGKDYAKLLKFYGKPISKRVSTNKSAAEKLVAHKLCDCIKSMSRRKPRNNNSIAICTKSVITRKSLKRGKFTCKKRQTIKLYK